MTKKTEYVVWAGMKQREVDPFDGVLFMRGFPTPVDEGDAKELKKNPNFVFIDTAQATEIVNKLKEAPDRKAQRAIAQTFAESLQGKVTKQKEDYVKARDKLRKEAADEVEALRKKQAAKPFLVVTPDSPLPDGAKDFGGGYAEPPEDEPEDEPEEEPEKKTATAKVPPPAKAGDKGGADK